MGDAQAVIALLEPIEKKVGKQIERANTKENANDLAIAYMLGMAYLRAGKADLGQVRIDRILRNGESAEAHVLMGLALREAHDLAGAVQSFGKAVALNPNLPDVHAMYGLALIASGNRDKAREEFEAELKANPHDYTANVNLGVIAKEDQRLDEAAAFFERALKVRPADPATRYQVATLKMAASDVPTARGRRSKRSSPSIRTGSSRTCRSRRSTIAWSVERTAIASGKSSIGRRRKRRPDNRARSPQPAPPVSQPPASTAALPLACRATACLTVATSSAIISGHGRNPRRSPFVRSTGPRWRGRCCSRAKK